MKLLDFFLIFLIIALAGSIIYDVQPIDDNKKQNLEKMELTVKGGAFEKKFKEKVADKNENGIITNIEYKYLEKDYNSFFAQEIKSTNKYFNFENVGVNLLLLVFMLFGLYFLIMKIIRDERCSS